SGVHASYFVAHFDGPENLPDDLAHRLNKMIPIDIHVMTAQPCEPNFHARFDELHWGLWDKETSVPLPLDKEQEFLKVVGRDVLCGFREVSVPPPQGCEYQQREFYS
ncbi:MAG: hypothetical protein ACKO67_00300, partial [Bacteroidota bacterium]